MDSLNRFSFAFGLLFLVAGAGLMFSSSQLIAENKKLGQELQRLKNYLHYEHIASKVAAALPGSEAMGDVHWSNLHKQLQRMPYTEDD